MGHQHFKFRQRTRNTPRRPRGVKGKCHAKSGISESKEVKCFKKEEIVYNVKCFILYKS